MKNNQYKNLIFFIFACLVIFGFMIKLPKIFHHFDKELHSLFYFGTFIFLALLFPNKRFFVSVVLFLFGIFIEIAQDYSNRISLKYIGKVIHGRFDIEDIKFNCIGLFLGIIIFHLSKYFINKYSKLILN